MAVTLIVNIQVEDFSNWKKAFDKASEFRNKLGIEVKGIYQSLEDEKSISLISEYPSLEIAENILANPEWESNQRKSGVIKFETAFFNAVP